MINQIQLKQLWVKNICSIIYPYMQDVFIYLFPWINDVKYMQMSVKIVLLLLVFADTNYICWRQSSSSLLLEYSFVEYLLSIRYFAHNIAIEISAMTNIDGIIIYKIWNILSLRSSPLFLGAASFVPFVLIPIALFSLNWWHLSESQNEISEEL